MPRNLILGLTVFATLLACSSQKESQKASSGAGKGTAETGKDKGSETNSGSDAEKETSTDKDKEQDSQSDPAEETDSSADGWYKPKVDVRWQIQLTGNLNTSFDVELYDVDLFDTSKEKIAELKKAGRKVICYFSAGSSEDWRPDYASIDASIKGKNLDGWPGEKWLDISSPLAEKLYISRVKIAKDKGCDGVDPDNVDGYTQNSGFTITKAQQLSFNKMMAREAHKLGLSVGLKNDLDQAAELAADFDFSVNEQCQEYKECELLNPFLKLGKPVLNIEYKKAKADASCAYAKEANLRTLVLPLDLDGSERRACFE